MKVTKAMVHEDLQPMYGYAALLPRLIRFRFVVKLLNWMGRRNRTLPSADGIAIEEVTIPSRSEDTEIRTLLYKPEGHKADLPIMLYCHGGGYILGNPEQFHDAIVQFIRTRPCIVIAPDYRKALTAPFPAGFNDCFDTLLWARDNADELSGKKTRMIIAGHSAGGGLTAALSLKARDTGDIDVAFQMPIYPMIDDTQPDDATRAMSAPVWDTNANRLGWDAYLAGLHSAGEAVTPYAAAARSEDYRGLPPTITFVGDMEPFCEETRAYVSALKAVEVDTAFREYPGCFHGFDFFKAPISRDAQDFTYNSFADFYDRYVTGGS